MGNPITIQMHKDITVTVLFLILGIIGVYLYPGAFYLYIILSLLILSTNDQFSDIIGNKPSHILLFNISILSILDVLFGHGADITIRARFLIGPYFIIQGLCNILNNDLEKGLLYFNKEWFNWTWIPVMIWYFYGAFVLESNCEMIFNSIIFVCRLSYFPIIIYCFVILSSTVIIILSNPFFEPPLQIEL